MSDNPYASPLEKCGEVDWTRRFMAAASFFGKQTICLGTFVFVMELALMDWLGALLVAIFFTGACFVDSLMSAAIATYDESKGEFNK